jgi:hypothetical protein
MTKTTNSKLFKDRDAVRLEKTTAKWIMENRPAEGYKGFKATANFFGEVKTMNIEWSN